MVRPDAASGSHLAGRHSLPEHLPVTQREILKMRIFQDMSFKDIAESEDISINTALGRMRYALINLRKLIDKHHMVTDI